MINTVILSIKPQYVKDIINGLKKYEYRKKIWTREVEKVLIYSSFPIQKIVGEFTIETILKNSIEDLWNETGSEGGISKHAFMDYFNNVEEGYAIKIKDLKVYEDYIDPNKIIDNWTAPQNFRYYEEKRNHE